MRTLSRSVLSVIFWNFLRQMENKLFLKPSDTLSKCKMSHFKLVLQVKNLKKKNKVSMTDKL